MKEQLRGKKIYKKKKTLMILGFLVGCLLITNILAIWIVSIMTTATYKIQSQAYGGLIINQELSSNNFNSLNDSAKFTDMFIFTNEGEEVDMNFSISTSKSSTDPSCVNWENDCEIDYYFNENKSEILNDGYNVKRVIKGINNVSVEVNCLQYSCPQDISTTIGIEKIPV